MRAYIRLILCIGVITATTLGVVGCISSTNEERDYRRAIDSENWETCKLAYRQAQKAHVSIHMHLKGRPHRPYEIQEDLVSNHCRFVLGKYWAHY